jgi:hypothetical protein
MRRRIQFERHGKRRVAQRRGDNAVRPEQAQVAVGAALELRAARAQKARWRALRNHQR